jgi:MFS family permease
MLALLAAVQVLGMSLWFTASAVAPWLSAAWGLTPADAGWLTMAVQLGFVAGTALSAVLNLADVWPSRWLVAGAAVLASASNALVAWAPGFEVAVPLRFLTGLFLAGVYPPAMKMAATWFRARRGLAIGTIVGALTLGKALPYLFEGLFRRAPSDVILAASAGALAAAVLVLFAYRDGPEPFPRRPFSWGLVGAVLRHRETRLAIGAYLGHMWELYAGWTALSLFFHDFFAGRGHAAADALAMAGLVAAAGIAAGGPGSVLAGLWADRFGRERVAGLALAVSGACALVLGWLAAAPAWLVVGLALVWGAAIVADSAQFSALVTETSPQHAVGTALTLQTSLGFLLTAFAIGAMLAVRTRFGWGAALSMLAIGPALGIAQLVVLRSARAAPAGVPAAGARPA